MLVARPRLKHPFPFRTRQLSASGSMVLVPQGTGRVDRCQHWFLWNLFGRQAIKKSFVGVILLFFSSSLSAVEIMSSADVMEGGKWSVSVYGRSVKIEPVLKVSDSSAVQIPLTSGSATISSSSNAEIDFDQEFEEVVAAIKFRPKNGLTYRLKVGQVRSFDIEFSSGGHSNKFEATRDGLVWGLGAEWSVYPGSIVSPAVTLDAGWTQRVVSLDRFESPGVVAVTDDKFQQDEVQLALNISKRWNKFEPFAGIKLNRVVSRLQDNGTKQSLQGTQDGVAPFVGLQLEIFESESIIIEASFVDEASISAGINLKF